MDELRLEVEAGGFGQEFSLDYLLTGVDELNYGVEDRGFGQGTSTYSYDISFSKDSNH